MKFVFWLILQIGVVNKELYKPVGFYGPIAPPGPNAPRCLSANLECMSEMCCTRLAGNAGCKKSSKNLHLGTIAQLCQAISWQLRHVSTIGKKNLLNSNISSTCPHNMVNFGPLMAEICWRVWGTPANFNGFRVLAALLHGTLEVGVSQTLRR